MSSLVSPYRHDGHVDISIPIRTQESMIYLAFAAMCLALLRLAILKRRSFPRKGPKITASVSEGLCGFNTLSVGRLPKEETCQASWAILLATIHPASVQRSLTSSDSFAPTDSHDWSFLTPTPISIHQGKPCVTISRITLQTLLSITNARATVSKSSASGYRAILPSYCGQWMIESPIGGTAHARLLPSDSHTREQDVYPPTFSCRVDSCVRMMAGVVVSQRGDFKVGFTDRKAKGRYGLALQSKGFAGAHSGRHLLQMNGCRVFDIDLLVPKILEGNRCRLEGCQELIIPSLEQHGTVSLLVPGEEQIILAHALDCLPWSSLPWSIHRGMKDILLAYSTKTMETYREAFASQVQRLAATERVQLHENGWHDGLLDMMGAMAHAAITSDARNSGDMVRIVTAVVALASEDEGGSFDETSFWRTQQVSAIEPRNLNPKLDFEISLSSDTLIALTKCFVLRWSNDFDYQMYHKLPNEILFG